MPAGNGRPRTPSSSSGNSADPAAPAAGFTPRARVLDQERQHVVDAVRACRSGKAGRSDHDEGGDADARLDLGKPRRCLPRSGDDPFDHPAPPSVEIAGEGEGAAQRCVASGNGSAAIGSNPRIAKCRSVGLAANAREMLTGQWNEDYARALFGKCGRGRCYVLDLDSCRLAMFPRRATQVRSARFQSLRQPETSAAHIERKRMRRSTTCVIRLQPYRVDQARIGPPGPRRRQNTNAGRQRLPTPVAWVRPA